MAEPNFLDTLKMLEGKGSIEPSELELYMRNYTFFESARQTALKTYSHQWVAALDNQIHTAKTFKTLTRQLQAMPNHTYAYIVQIP